MKGIKKKRNQSRWEGMKIQKKRTSGSKNDALIGTSSSQAQPRWMTGGRACFQPISTVRQCKNPALSWGIVWSAESRTSVIAEHSDIVSNLRRLTSYCLISFLFSKNMCYNDPFFPYNVSIQLFKQINIPILIDWFGQKNKVTDVLASLNKKQKQTKRPVSVSLCFHANKHWEINAGKLPSTR